MNVTLRKNVLHSPQLKASEALQKRVKVTLGLQKRYQHLIKDPAGELVILGSPEISQVNK